MEKLILPVTDSPWEDPVLMKENESLIVQGIAAARNAYPKLSDENWRELIRDERTYNSIAWSLLSTGYMPKSIVSGTVFGPFTASTMSSEQFKSIPPRIHEYVSNMFRPPVASYVFTRKEGWWRGPHEFVVNDEYSYALWWWYNKAVNDLELQDWMPAKTYRSAVSKEQSTDPLYGKWLDYCKTTKAIGDELKCEWEAAIERQEAARLAYKQGAKCLSFKDWKAQQTT